jgi:toxin ParE1/3/4
VARLQYTAAARTDLEQIYRYIRDQSGSGAVAIKFVGELRGKCRDLAAAPITMGRPRNDLRPDVRSYPHGNYVIFFRYLGDTLEIVQHI